MRITRFLDSDGTLHAGIDLGGGHADVFPGPDPLSPREPTGRRVAIARRLAPIAPPVIFCIGLNYRAHAEETGADIPERPVVFMKPPTAVNDPDQPIVLPACSTRPEVDYEVELVVIIGTEAKNVPVGRALDHVLGYTCGNDVSARWWQKQGGGGQWVRGKGFDTFAPLGPVLVTADEVPDPQALSLKTVLNGQTMQDSTTADMIFPVAELIAFLSQDTTLRPGTAIFTGTPPGIGAARDPKVFLQPGDTVKAEIERIGALTNPVVDPARI